MNTKALKSTNRKLSSKKNKRIHKPKAVSIKYINWNFISYLAYLALCSYSINFHEIDYKTNLNPCDRKLSLKKRKKKPMLSIKVATSRMTHKFVR